MIKQIWIKEIRAGLFTWKSALWLIIASLLFSFTSYLLLTNKELSLLDQTELLWLLAKIIIGVAFLVVAIDASSIITSEFEKETAESIFLSPISLKQFLTGKLLASLTLWIFIFIIACPYIIVSAAGSHLTWAFLIYTAFLGTLGLFGLVITIFALSLFYRASKNTLTTALVILLVFVIPATFSSTLKNNSVASVFSRINPIDNIFSSLDNILVDYKISFLQNWTYIWPIIIFCLLSLALLFLAIRTFYKEGVINNN